ncbi:MAG: hypothetical protein ABFC42_14105 [Sulfuricella sp.]
MISPISDGRFPRTPSEDNDFERAQGAFRKGDPRPLAEFVLRHDLTQEQREYVALAICGDVERVDGRKVKPTTDSILNDYSTLLWMNRMVTCFELEDSGAKVLNDSDAARILAQKYGYTDSDSVRRLLARRGREIKCLLTDDLGAMNGKTGHEKK